MIKYLSAFMVCTLLSCGGQTDKQETAENGSQTPAGEAALDGAKLIAKSDCRACHAENETLIGPGYQQVAEKYPMSDSTVSYLATKIIAGGSGNWGSTPMPPHPQHSKEEAAAMVQYILSLKN